VSTVPAAAPQASVRKQLTVQRTLRYFPRIFVATLVAFAVIYVFFIAQVAGQQGNWRATTFGSIVHDPGSAIRVLLDSLTFAGALFIVASGFALIFGLMRVVNMAHGAFYLLGGYIAYEIQQTMTGQGFSLQASEVNTWEWVVPLLVAAPCIAVVGLVTQQAFLRWNQGQELRQALITIAVSVIIADQIIGHFPRTVSSGAQRFGGNQVDLTWPGWTDRFVNLHIWGVQYSLIRLLIFGMALSLAISLWLWLYKTRTGMVIRAGVDDRQMASALGVNIQRTFAIAFVVGSALAAFGAVVWGSQAGLAQGQDGLWLLYSLVVVIVGGMGSIFGAAAGAILFGLVYQFSGNYLPTTGSDCCTQYSPIITFVLIALVLAFRPQGLFGREG
jgi:branched-chain amino acid transport system permease protein